MRSALCRSAAVGLGGAGIVALAAPSALANTMLFTTSSDWTGWTAGNGTPAVSTTYDSDGITINGAGNNPGNSGGSINVGGTSAGGSLQITDSNNLGYGTLAYSPGEAYNQALMTAIDPGSIAAYTAASGYGNGTLVAYSGTLLLNYTQPSVNAGGSYLQFGVFFNDSPDGYYHPQLQSSVVSDGTINGFTTYTATIPYSLSAGSFGNLNMGIFVNSNETLSAPVYFDSLQVYTPVVFNPVNAKWIYNGSGAWETGSNWNPSTPGVTGSTATFDSNGGTITANPTVTLSSAITLDSITFNTSAVAYTINASSGATITLDTGPSVNVLAGNHTINVPLILGTNNTTFNISSGASLTTPGVSGGGYGVVHLTGGGSLTTGLLQNVSLYVDAGTYTMQNGVDSGGYLYGITTAAGATFNLGSNNLLYNNTISGSGTYNVGSGSTVITGLFGGDTFTGTVAGSGTIAIGNNSTGSANVVSFQGNNTFTGGYVVAGGGTFAILSGVNIGAGGASNTVTLDNGNLLALASFTATQALNVTANGGTLNSGGFNVGVGAITVAAGGSLAISPQNAGGGVMVITAASLNVSAGSSIVLGNAAAHSDKTLLVTGGLSLAGSTGAWTGLIDLGGNDLIVHGGSLATLTNQVARGYNAGTWTGAGGGIQSAAAAGNSNHLTALGVIQNSVNGTATGATLYSTFDGVASSAGDVLVKYTYYGDTNLDGKVDGSDYSRIDNGFLHGLTGWFNGDFNYDGVVNGSDYTLIDNAFNSQGAALSDAVASPTAQVAGASSVPEPASASLIAMTAAGVLGRRRQRSIR